MPTSKYALIFLALLALASADTIWEKGRQTAYAIEYSAYVPQVNTKTSTGGQKRAYTPSPLSALYAPVTAYSKQETCPKKDCITKSGRRAQKGISASCPRIFTLGQFVSIAGHTYRCDDWTSLAFNGRFDLYFGDASTAYQAAKDWGVKILPVSYENN